MFLWPLELGYPEKPTASKKECKETLGGQVKKFFECKSLRKLQEYYKGKE